MLTVQLRRYLSYSRIEFNILNFLFGHVLWHVLLIVCISYHLKISQHQDEDIRHPPSRTSQDGGDYGLGYGAYDVYIAAATMFGALGPPAQYDHPGPAYGSKSFDHRGSAYGSSPFL